MWQKQTDSFSAFASPAPAGLALRAASLAKSRFPSLDFLRETSPSGLGYLASFLI